MEPATPTTSADATSTDGARAPTIVRVLVALAFAGALYLIAVRHEAILADLSNLTAWCF